MVNRWALCQPISREMKCGVSMQRELILMYSYSVEMMEMVVILSNKEFDGDYWFSEELMSWHPTLLLVVCTD